MPLKGNQGRPAASTHTSNASRTQVEAQGDPLFDTDNNEAVDEADVAQLREQMCTLTQARRDDQDTLRLILEQLATLAAAQAAQQTPVRFVERDDSSNTSNLGSQDRTPRYSKKQPDPNPLSDGADPTFESWKLQI
jgi:hypothetical protein